MGRKEKLQVFPTRNPVYLPSSLLHLSPKVSAQDSFDVPPIREFNKYSFSLSLVKTNSEKDWEIWCLESYVN